MKKYCKNCKYWLEMYDICGYKIFKIDKELSEIVGVNMGTNKSVDYKESNKDNNCKYYKKKWLNFI